MTWLLLVMLTLGAWRTWALLARDLILDPVRDRLAPKDTKRRDWLECPYCSGFWHAGAWVTVYDFTRDHTPGFVVWQLHWWAVAALVVLLEIAVDHVTD